MRNLVYGLIILTQIDGNPVLVESTQLAVVSLHGEHCEEAGGTVIQVAQTRLCVKETKEQIRDKKIECETQQLCD